ncbi:MAG: amino acid ABC transporter permease, partial [Oceanospirillaceae bacterium]|nr:amino acid ABC transporter permease [Oceanospirillaceae bacterium]
MKEFQPIPARPAPEKTVGLVAWMRENLFSSIPNSVVTLALIAFLVYYIPPIVDWAFLSANWSGTTEDACVKEGACWVFINAWSYQFFYGTYPIEEVWRINLMIVLLLIVIGMSFKLPKHYRMKASIAAWLALPIIGMAVLYGGWGGLEVVSTDLWGGFTLNVFMAAASIIVAFPFSFLWALGRRSQMPFIRSVSVIFI